MPIYQYRLQSRSKWSAMPGVALLAIVNKIGSGKKFNIQSVEIANCSRLGYMQTIDTSSAVPIRYKVMMVSGLSGGEDIVPICSKFDTTFPNLSGIVDIRTGAAWDAPLTPLVLSGLSSLTDSTVSIGDTTFTPTVTFAWITNEHRDSDRWFVVASGNNIGTYQITANAASTLTLDPPLWENGSTTGYVAEHRPIRLNGIVKSFTTAGGTPHFINTARGQLAGGKSFGTIYEHNRDSSTQRIIVRPGEHLALTVPSISISNPAYISTSFALVSGVTSYAYSVDLFAPLSSEKESIISFDLSPTSPYTLRLSSITLTEVGSHDTPYFQIVPISGVEASAYADSEKQVPVIKWDTTSPSFSSSWGNVFTTVPVYPFNVPFAYFAEGSAGIPKGFNYLGTKDFMGPLYFSYFPENAAYKTTGSSSTLTPGTLGTHVGMNTSVMRRTPITVREGEGFAIVSGAESATGTLNVGVSHSGWGLYEFGITFTVENATSPQLVLTGLQNNTEVRVFTAGTTTALAGQEDVATGTFSWDYEYAPNTYVDIVIHNIQYEYIRLQSVALPSTGLTIPIQQRYDRNFSNPA